MNCKYCNKELIGYSPQKRTCFDCKIELNKTYYKRQHERIKKRKKQENKRLKKQKESYKGHPDRKADFCACGRKLGPYKIKWCSERCPVKKSKYKKMQKEYVEKKKKVRTECCQRCQIICKEKYCNRCKEELNIV